MSKILCLGDLHCRPIWKDIVAKEGDSCDKIVFLGDYTCPREVKLDDPTDACGFLYEVLDFKDKNPDKVILLRGNHCLSSLGYDWAECYPRDYPEVELYWQTKDVKNWYLSNTQWIYRIPDTNIVYSHAGISEQFLDNVCKYFKSKDGWDFNIYDQDQLIDHINNIEPCSLFGFTPCRYSDVNGNSETQPCTWIRPETLLYHGVKDIIHVVGHTPAIRPFNIKNEIPDQIKRKNCCDIWCCDCLEYKAYLVIENNKFIPKFYESKIE